MSTNISQGRVEWPMVHNVPGCGCTGSIPSCCRDEDEAALTASSLGWRHPVQSRGRGCDERFLQRHGPHRADPEVPAQVPQRRCVHRPGPGRRHHRAGRDRRPKASRRNSRTTSKRSARPSSRSDRRCRRGRTWCRRPTSPRWNTCRTKWTPVPFDAIRDMVESQLGVRMNRAFATFDEMPLGSASLAQVHRATLRDGARGRGQGAAAGNRRLGPRGPRCAHAPGRARGPHDRPRPAHALRRLGPRVRQGADGRARLPGRSREPRAIRQALQGLSRTVRAGADLGLLRAARADDGTRHRHQGDRTDGIAPHGAEARFAGIGADARIPGPDVRARRDPRRPASGQPAGHRRLPACPVRPGHGRARAARSNASAC